MLDLAKEIVIGGSILLVAVFFIIILGCVVISQAFRVVEWLDRKFNLHLLPWD